MPVTNTLRREHKPRNGVALGGIGAGWFELRHDGVCTNWNIFNNQPLFRGQPFRFDPKNVLFFVVRYHVEGEEPRLVLLQIEDSHGSAALEGHEFQYVFPWIIGVDQIESSATFPFTKLRFTERDMPLAIELEAWSPFIPHDVKHSALPAAFFDFRVISKTPKPVRVTLLASMRNCVGYDLPDERLYDHRIVRQDGFAGFEHGGTRIDPAHSSAGTHGVYSRGEDSRVYTGWQHLHPYYERLLREDEMPEVNDTAGRNPKDRRTGRQRALPECYSSVGRSFNLSGDGKQFDHGFAVTWHFPNNYARQLHEEGAKAGYLEDASFPGKEGPAAAAAASSERRNEGHYYANFFHNSTEVAGYALAKRAWLEAETRAFQQAFFDSTVEPWLLEQVNSHFNTLRTSAWLTKQGDFGINEGLSPTQSYAGLATIDVAMYGQVMVSALFPVLDRSTIEAHRRLQNPNGSVLHSISHNFQERDPGEASAVRVDMPAQYVYLALRHCLWTNDRGYLESIWPSVRAAMDYILRERDKDGNKLPDMEGIMCSYDNFPMYGTAPYVATQWLAAAGLMVRAAEWLGDAATAKRFADVVKSGSETVERLTWTGSYYRLYAAAPDGSSDNGCMTDQVIGDWARSLVGTPAFLDQDRVRTAMRTIMKMNYRPNQGLRNCQWPGDPFLHPVDPDCWVDQANTCWTGVELAFASHLFFAGLHEEARTVVKNVDDRYRRYGMYWDHQEFGGHYFRPMSAWAIVHGILGLSIQAGTYRFAPKATDGKLRMLFPTTDGYAHFDYQDRQIRIAPLRGTVTTQSLIIELPSIPANATVHNGWEAAHAWTFKAEKGIARIDGPLRIPVGASIRIRW